MPSSRKIPSPPEAKTINWFEREMLAHTPQQSILDATSLGIWTICEQSGILAGAWKQHRILLQDLDTEQAMAALGEMLAAIAQTAHAIGFPLETVMQQQVERAQTMAPPVSRHRKSPAAKQRGSLSAPDANGAGITPTPLIGSLPVAMTTAKRGRPRRPVADKATIPPPEAPLPLSLLPANGVKRGRPRKLPKGDAAMPTTVLAAPPPPRGAREPRPVQPTLLGDVTTSSAPKPLRTARVRKPTR